MERKDQVLCKVFEVLKDEEVLAKITSVGKLEDGYEHLKEKLDDVTEVEYKEAIQAIRENDGKIEIQSDEEVELSDEELEKVSGGYRQAGVHLSNIDVGSVAITENNLR